jgi:hypothetical protein
MMRLLDMNEDAEDTEAEIVSKAPRYYSDPYLLLFLC